MRMDCFHSAICANQGARFWGTDERSSLSSKELSLFKAFRQSPTTGMETGMFFLMDVGSISMWMICAWEAKQSVFPVTLSSKRTPMPNNTSQWAVAMFARFLRVERGHYKMFRDLLSQVTADSPITDTPVYVCSECGNTTTGRRPELCEVCGRRGGEFMDIA